MSQPPDKAKPVVEAAQSPVQSDMTARALHLRIRQQEILAELGVVALQGAGLDELLNETVRLTADGLEAEFCKILEYLPEQKELLVRAGLGWDAGVVGIARIGADLDSPAGFALRTGKPVISNHLENEERFRTPALLTRHGIHRAMNVILQGDGTPFGVLEVDSRSKGDFSKNDITFLQGAANVLGMAIERERRERRLKAAVARQELLLKEINHRVKNSLTLVTSMLSLQIGKDTGTELQQRLQEAANRVSAISRAHERLYQNNDVDVLELGGYLRDVCQDLNLSSTRCTVEVKAVEGVRIATDRAIPFVLLATELVTNAVKYAYPDRENGKVQVSLTRRGADHIVLTVADDGIGLPEGFDGQASKSLGMRMVRAFTAQLGAALSVRDRQPGSEFVLVAPLTADR
ncbi:MAG: GAF domain-containing protein [Alphaproteobacteria bacterium]|nr:GAF domain-containing protein [Alphaproteobacteria bacterium]